VKWAECDKTDPENCKNCSSKCAYDCAQLHTENVNVNQQVVLHL